MRLVLITAPTPSVVKDGRPTMHLLSLLARLRNDTPDIAFISLLLESLALLPYLQVNDASVKYQADFCNALIDRCDEVWVLMFDGWDKSKAVTDQIARAQEKSVPVLYMDVNSHYTVGAKDYLY